MLTKVLVFIAIAILLTSLTMTAIYKRKQINKLVELVQIFVLNYEYFKNIIERDLGLKEILNEMNLGQDISNINLELLVLDFGIRDKLVFDNTKELRKNFLKVGSFIMKYEEFIQKEYGLEYDKTEDYETFLEVLRKIKQICLGKGESICVSWEEPAHE